MIRASHRGSHAMSVVHVKLSAKAQAVCQKMNEMYDRHVRSMTEVATQGDLDTANATLRRLERFWGTSMSYATR